jgi:hypothetical protein
MSSDEGATVSAQVILRPASRRAPTIQGAVTAADVAALQPPPEAIAETQGAFAAAGFDVGEVVGNSFSITAPASRFEQLFRTHLGRTARGGVQAVGAHYGLTELPGVLASEWAKLVYALVFARRC